MHVTQFSWWMWPLLLVVMLMCQLALAHVVMAVAQIAVQRGTISCNTIAASVVLAVFSTVAFFGVVP